MDFISAFIEPYQYTFLYNLYHLIELLLSILLFSSLMKRKPLFLLRLLAGLGFCLFIYAILVVFRTEAPPLIARSLSLLLESLSILVMLRFCFQERVTTIILYWCAGVAACEIGANFYSLLLNICGIDYVKYASVFGGDSLFFNTTLFFFIHILIYLALFYLFGRFDCEEIEETSRKKITLLAFCSIILISLLSGVTYVYRAESEFLYTISRCYATIVCFFSLLLRSGFLMQSKNLQEISIMEQVIDGERKEYQSLKESMDIINMKCHDLKHQLNNISDKLTLSELQSLQEAIQIYDRNIKTGNEVLDVLLYEKSLVFNQENIRLSCMADGKLLSFMQVRHIYSLFNNALSNALEAVRQVDNPEKRVISIAMTKLPEDKLEISIMNYFSGSLDYSDTTISTSKIDKNHHGFGMMSMNYIAKQYGGTLETLVNGDIFTLQITIPLPLNEN